MTDIERWAPPAQTTWGQRRELEKILGTHQRETMIDRYQHDRKIDRIVAQAKEDELEMQGAEYVARTAMNGFLGLDEYRMSNATNEFQHKACQQIELRYLNRVAAVQGRHDSVFDD